MNIKLSLTAIIFFISASTFAQETRINAYASYVFDDAIDSYYGSNNNYFEGKVNGGLQWGVGIEYMMRENAGVELLYLRQDTKAPMTYSAGLGTNHADLDMGISYIMLAGNKYMRKPGGKVEGFGGLMLGACIADITDPETKKSGTATKFAWGIRLGANIWVSEKVAIKLQTNLLSAAQSAGGGLYFGTGGVGTGVSTYSSIYQFGLGGGLVFRIPKKK